MSGFANDRTNARRLPRMAIAGAPAGTPAMSIREGGAAALAPPRQSLPAWSCTTDCPSLLHASLVGWITLGVRRRGRPLIPKSASRSTASIKHMVVAHEAYARRRPTGEKAGAKCILPPDGG